MSEATRIAAAPLWDLREAVRRQSPLVHNITNFVVMNSTANALLALGASPAMVHSPDEVEDFVAISQALVINIGTLESAHLAAYKLAALRAHIANVPWVIDPVGAGATPYRRAAAAAMLRLKPTVIRGNASEILTVADAERTGKGVDSLQRSEAALEAARDLAQKTESVVAITGAVDYVTDGWRVASIRNGHPMMAKITGSGCSATATIGAFLAVTSDVFWATIAALSVFAVSGECAAEKVIGPGSLQVALLDALYTLDAQTFAARAQVEVTEYGIVS